MDPLVVKLLLAFAIGIAGSFIGTVSGGGGLLSLPLLIFLGLPPQTAIATGKFAGIGLSIGGIAKFWKEKKIVWKFALPFSLMAIVGGYVGAKLLLEINEKTLLPIIGIILLALLPFLLIKKKFGVQYKETSPMKKKVGYVLYFIAMIYGGVFGAGGFIPILYILIFFFGFTIIQANATDLIPWFILSITASIVFFIEGAIDIPVGIVLFLGMLIGGYIGAHTAVKKGDAWVKSFFAVVVIASAIKFLFF